MAALSAGARVVSSTGPLFDERLADAWAADLAACEARQRRDELASAAGVDPVRAGDRSFVTMLIEVARSEMRRGREGLGGQRPARLAVTT